VRGQAGSGIGILCRIMVCDVSWFVDDGEGRCANFGGIGAAAAQVVPHVHFHIIPRPGLTPELRNRSFTMFGRGQRSGTCWESERGEGEGAGIRG
jgi:hypothetical protein